MRLSSPLFTALGRTTGLAQTIYRSFCTRAKQLVLRLSSSRPPTRSFACSAKSLRRYTTHTLLLDSDGSYDNNACARMPEQQPDFEAGVKYWQNTSADVDGVLGGYGE